MVRFRATLWLVCKPCREGRLVPGRRRRVGIMVRIKVMAKVWVWAGTYNTGCSRLPMLGNVITS